MDFTSQEEIQHEGEHLTTLAEIIAAVGVTVTSLVPEMGVHLGEETAEGFKRFAFDFLKPALEGLETQLEQLVLQFNNCQGEVSQLEELLALPDADKA